jgi:hypothetical protein
MDEKNPDELSCGPLAWVLQKLKTHLDLKFNEGQLEKCFPRYRPGGPVPNEESEAVAACVNAKISKTNGILLSIMGRRTRKPGCIRSPETSVPDVEMHRSVRLRGHGQSSNDPAIAGYRPDMDPDGSYFWARDFQRTRSLIVTLGLKVLTGSSSGSGSTQGGGEGEGEIPSHMAHRINEAEVGTLEAELMKPIPSPT